MNTENTLNRAYAHWLKDGLSEIGLVQISGNP